MGYFECCHNCVKRTPGCHGTCPEYIKQKRAWENIKAIRDQKRREEPVLYNFKKKIKH